MFKGKLEEMGLQDYLNASKEFHNGYGFEDFAKRIENDESRVSMAKDFGVTRTTIYEWIRLYDKMLAEEKK